MDEEQTSRLFELADVILAIGRHIQAAKETGAESETGTWTPLEGAVMRYIDRHPGTTAAAAAEATHLISSNFARALRDLERKGLVRREADPRDARRVLLHSTEMANDHLQRLRDTWSRLLAGTLGGAEEIDATLTTLRAVEGRLLDRSRHDPA